MIAQLRTNTTNALVVTQGKDRKHGHGRVMQTTLLSIINTSTQCEYQTNTLNTA